MLLKSTKSSQKWLISAKLCHYILCALRSQASSASNLSINALSPCLKGQNNLWTFLNWILTLVAHIMSRKLLRSIMIILVKFHWIEMTLHHFECQMRQRYIQPKNSVGLACVHFLNSVQFTNVWVTFLVFRNSFWGKQNEYLETDL